MKKLNFVSRNSAVRKMSSVACGFSSIKSHFSDYPKSLIIRRDEVYLFFNKNIAILMKKNSTSFLTVLFCCNHTYYCIGMVSVTSSKQILDVHPRSDSMELHGTG